jgi:hypothetical protein
MDIQSGHIPNANERHAETYARSCSIENGWMATGAESTSLMILETFIMYG